LVDITRCEKCGKVIPAIETGCAYCDAEEAQQAGFREDDWMPLAIRMLLWMFLVNLAGTAVLAGFALVSAGGFPLEVFAAIRMAIALATLVAILARHPAAGFLPFLFLGYELLCFLGASAGLVWGTGWMGSWVAPLWNVLFGFLFMRDDVRARLNRRSADRQEVGRLLDEIRRRDD
jgi:hypothetical protein